MRTKAARAAIAAVSRLAEEYDSELKYLSADLIAKDRLLKRPFLGKILSALTHAGIVTSERGPGGGFALARPPSKISLDDVLRLFEKTDELLVCPFGGGICGAGEACPLHEQLVKAQEPAATFYENTTFEIFRKDAAARRDRDASS